MSHIITQGVRRDFELADDVALAILADSLDDDGRHAEADVFRAGGVDWSARPTDYSWTATAPSAYVTLGVSSCGVRAAFSIRDRRAYFSAHANNNAIPYWAALSLCVRRSLVARDPAQTIAFLSAYLPTIDAKPGWPTTTRQGRLFTIRLVANALKRQREADAYLARQTALRIGEIPHVSTED